MAQVENMKASLEKEKEAAAVLREQQLNSNNDEMRQAWEEAKAAQVISILETSNTISYLYQAREAKLMEDYKRIQQEREQQVSVPSSQMANKSDEISSGKRSPSQSCRARKGERRG